MRELAPKDRPGGERERCSLRLTKARQPSRSHYRRGVSEVGKYRRGTDRKIRTVRFLNGGCHRRCAAGKMAVVPHSNDGSAPRGPLSWGHDDACLGRPRSTGGHQDSKKRCFASKNGPNPVLSCCLVLLGEKRYV